MIQFILLLLSLSFQYSQAATIAKKNLCTITINSNEEAELFKKHLPAKDWNFIELTTEDAQSENKNWFQQACKKNISCDILVISGHFGGSFFGKSKFNLSMDELETRSCESDCSGILNNPKEVFLFGCNTLATKDVDLRTPEQYMQALLADGLPATQASQVVSFRYSSFGESFKDRMTAVFSKTPRIYGFSSKGPSGASVSRQLNNYLQSSQRHYENFSAMNFSSLPVKNENLFSAMSNTSFVQASGSLLSMKKVEEKPYCYIRSEKQTRLQKLKYIEQVFEKGNAIPIISHIENFIHSVRTSATPLSPEEQKVLDDLTGNQKIMKELTAVLKLNSEIYIPLKVEILKTLQDLNIASAEFVRASVRDMVDLKTPFTDIRRDMLCSTNFNLSIPASVIPEARWSELNFITAMMCLKSKDAAIQEKILFQLMAKDLVIRGTAVWFYYGTQTKNISVHLALAKTLSDSESSVRQSAAVVLMDLKPQDPKIIEMMAKALVIEQDEYVFNSIRQAISKIPMGSGAASFLIDHADKSKYRDQIIHFAMQLKQK